MENKPKVTFRSFIKLIVDLYYHFGEPPYIICAMIVSSGLYFSNNNQHFPFIFLVLSWVFARSVVFIMDKKKEVQGTIIIRFIFANIERILMILITLCAFRICFGDMNMFYAENVILGPGYSFFY